MRQIDNIDMDGFNEFIRYPADPIEFTDWHSQDSIIFDSINGETFYDSKGNVHEFRTLWNSWTSYELTSEQMAMALRNPNVLNMQEMNAKLTEEEIAAGSEVVKNISNRINSKIEDFYFADEIGILPPGRFARYLRRTITQQMDRLGPVYFQIIRGLDLRDNGNVGNKSIVLNSDFPQQAITQQQRRYGTDSTEADSISTSTLPQMDQIYKHLRMYTKDPDQIIIEACSKNFSNILR